MARPKKDEHEKRTETIRARVTAAEKLFVQQQAAAAGLNLTEYARRRVLGFKVSPAPRRADATLIREINAIGVNVNQLARAVNAGRTFKGDWQAIAEICQRVLAKVAADYGS